MRAFMSRTQWFWIVAMVVLVPAANAAAQTQRPAPRPAPARRAATAPRVFVAINGLFQSTTTDFNEHRTFDVYAEEAHFDTSYGVKNGPAFDGAVAVRIVGGLAAGVGVTHFGRSTDTTVDISIPHPFFFARPRTASGDASGVNRDETAVHLQARYVVAGSGRLQGTVFAGPSYFQVKQDLVTTVKYTEAYPYDTVTFSGVDTTSAKKSRIGFNVGGDVAYFFTRQFGVGGTVQFTRATVNLPTSAGSLSVDAGGLQTGGGVRFRF